MDLLSSLVILRHLAFAKNLIVDFLLFRVAEGNMEAVFDFAFELVDKNALTLDFVVVVVEKIVYLMDFVYAFVVDVVHLLGFVGKFSYFEMVEVVVAFVCDIL